MTVKLWVNWRGREVLTNQQLDERIDEAVKKRLNDEDCYAEDLEDYLDNNYTKMELFDILASGNQSIIEETLDDIKSGVAEGIRDWCECDIRGDYDEVKVEV